MNTLENLRELDSEAFYDLVEKLVSLQSSNEHLEELVRILTEEYKSSLNIIAAMVQEASGHAEFPVDPVEAIRTLRKERDLLREG